MSVTNLDVFPHTVGNLDDRPNLPADEMKEKFEHDCEIVWNKVREMVPDLNAKLPLSDLVKTVSSSSTDAKVPTAKAVYDAIADALLGAGGTIAEEIITDWLDDHPEATTTVTDGSITTQKLASGAVTDDKLDPNGLLSYVKNDISGTTRNLWTWGIPATTALENYTINDVNIPAGTYTVSGICNKTDTSQYGRIVFYKTSIAVGNVLANPTFTPNERDASTITLAEKADIIVVQYAASNSTKGISSWTNMQLEEGDSASKYIYHVTAKDFIARERLDAVEDSVAKATEDTYNLWKWGNVSTSADGNATVSNVSIPAGTYTLSANVAKSENASVRAVFYKNSVSVENVLANPALQPNRRSFSTFTLAEAADIIVLQYATSSSTHGVSTWSDIQIVSGKDAKPYVPTFSAKDSVSRAHVSAYEAVHDLVGTYSGPTSIRKELIWDVSQASPFVVSIDAKYTVSSGNAYPYLQMAMYTERDFKKTSMRYKVGEKGVYDLKTYRTIPYLWDSRPSYVEIVVPSNVTLTIRNAYLANDSIGDDVNRGLEFHAHDGDCTIVANQNLQAFKIAKAAHYKSCIVIPKVSSDGVWFAYHDDTFNVSTTYLRNPDGTTIESSEYDGLYFNQIPWSYLSTLISSKSGPTFDDSHLMTLDKFLSFCSMVGMQPVFSMHPRYGIQESSTLADLKALVKKHGLLDKLIIKVPLVLDEGEYNLSNLETIFEVFQNDIYAYEADAVNGMANPENVITLFDAVGSGITVRKVIEYWITQLYSDDTLAPQTIAAGYGISCVSTSHSDVSGDTISSFSSEDVKTLASMGVSEFTDAYNTSNGLYW